MPDQAIPTSTARPTKLYTPKLDQFRASLAQQRQQALPTAPVTPITNSNNLWGHFRQQWQQRVMPEIQKRGGAATAWSSFLMPFFGAYKKGGAVKKPPILAKKMAKKKPQGRYKFKRGGAVEKFLTKYPDYDPSK